MIDLNKQSGLPVRWAPDAKSLFFGEGASQANPQPDVRRREDMSGVLYDSDSTELDELYYMFRGLAMPGDEAEIRRKMIRYDITVVCPGTLGREYVKTAGHYHPEKPGTGLTYPEVYEVLHGRAHYLLQSPHPEHPDQLADVILIAAKPGDKVLIPPGFGHITINPGDDYLIMSNWVADQFSSVYEPIRSMGGGAYFELRTEEGPEFIANKRYRSLPPLQRCPVTPVPRFHLITGLPLYRVFQRDSSAFAFLVNPQDFRDVFDSYVDELKNA